MLVVSVFGIHSAIDFEAFFLTTVTISLLHFIMTTVTCLYLSSLCHFDMLLDLPYQISTVIVWKQTLKSSIDYYGDMLF